MYVPDNYDAFTAHENRNARYAYLADLEEEIERESKEIKAEQDAILVACWEKGGGYCKACKRLRACRWAVDDYIDKVYANSTNEEYEAFCKAHNI